jgi:hypothetical protein
MPVDMNSFCNVSTYYPNQILGDVSFLFICKDLLRSLELLCCNENLVGKYNGSVMVKLHDINIELVCCIDNLIKKCNEFVILYVESYAKNLGVKVK